MLHICLFDNDIRSHEQSRHNQTPVKSGQSILRPATLSQELSKLYHTYRSATPPYSHPSGIAYTLLYPPRIMRNQDLILLRSSSPYRTCRTRIIQFFIAVRNVPAKFEVFVLRSFSGRR